MTTYSIWLLLTKQIRSKWGRFLLASGGIVVGVWALTLTTSISLGLSETIVQAINSQPFARQMQVYQSEGSERSFFDFQGPPVFQTISFEDAQEIAENDSRIDEIWPTMLMDIRILGDSNVSCFDIEQSLDQNLAAQRLDPEDQSLVAEENRLITNLAANCSGTGITYSGFNSFYDTNRANWVGSTDAPKAGEVVSCFTCGQLNLNGKLGVEKPEEMIGKTITYEYFIAPRIEREGSEFSVIEQSGPVLSLSESIKKTVTITAVVDDRGSNSFGISNLYLPFTDYTDAFKAIEPEYNPSTFGVAEYNISINNFEDLDQVITDLQNEGFIVFSAGQLLIQSVNVAFSVLQVFLAGFGLIALIASVFGIVAVMTISVLERKKEIGILKSLGARDGDIFKLFVLESTWIGVLGWLIGTALALLSGLVINLIFTAVVNSNQEWRENLEALNITDFSPSFPWWLLLITFAIALFFTIIAGVIPSYRAGKQNPVDVLRSE